MAIVSFLVPREENKNKGRTGGHPSVIHSKGGIEKKGGGHGQRSRLCINQVFSYQHPCQVASCRERSDFQGPIAIHPELTFQFIEVQLMLTILANDNDLSAALAPGQQI